MHRRLDWLLYLLLFTAQPVLALCDSTDLQPLHNVAASDGPVATGDRVRVRAVVTGDFRGDDAMRGFFIQTTSPAPDGMPTGLFVYTPELPDDDRFGPGHEVVVDGRAGAFRGRPQISHLRAVQSCSEPGMPEAVALPFPATDRDDWTRFEGMLVRIDQPLTVTGNFHLARYGTLELAADGRLFRPTQFDEATAEHNAARRIVLDDGSYRQNPDPVPWLNDAGTRRTGSVITELEAVLTRAFGEWRLHPPNPAAVIFENANPRPTPPTSVADSRRIAGFNVENYFLTLGERGADTPAELARQRERLSAVATGLRADLLGLVEVENRPEVPADLADLLGEAVGLPGGYRHFGLEQPVGTDRIRVALLWHPERVELLAGPFIDEDAVHHRPPVAGHFRFGADGPGKIVAVIHHKAKTGCPSAGDIDRGQGCWNERRTRQSRALAEFVDDLREQTGTDRVLIIGDINAYGAEDPVQVLREAGMTDLLHRDLPRQRRYTYVFHGESGNLDIALASETLARDAKNTVVWHINADEPASLHDVTATEGPWRSSDHDPVIVDFRAGMH